MATLVIPISRSVRITRTAISPRFATRTLPNMQADCIRLENPRFWKTLTLRLRCYRASQEREGRSQNNRRPGGRLLASWAPDLRSVSCVVEIADAAIRQHHKCRVYGLRPRGQFVVHPVSPRPAGSLLHT